MPAFYRQSIQNAVNQQINIGKSKHRTTLNREAIGQVVSYCAVAAAHDLWDWGEKESTLLTLKMNNAAWHEVQQKVPYSVQHLKYLRNVALAQLGRNLERLPECAALLSRALNTREGQRRADAWAEGDILL